MSDLIIRGMELPQSCSKCRISNYDYCGFYCPIIKGHPIVDSMTDRRHKSCHLGAIPPHGDLIDRDELLKYRVYRTEMIDGEIKQVGYVYLDSVENAPVIIPAERSD